MSQQPTITVYTSGPRCVDCNAVKQWLMQQGYEFVERNIRVDVAALEDLTQLGYHSVPVTVIDGVAVDGLDMSALEAALGQRV